MRVKGVRCVNRINRLDSQRTIEASVLREKVSDGNICSFKVGYSCTGANALVANMYTIPQIRIVLDRPATVSR